MADNIVKIKMPKTHLPNMEMPLPFREGTEAGVKQARDACAKAKMATEEAADLLEAIYESAAKHVTGLNRKHIDNARTYTRCP